MTLRDQIRSDPGGICSRVIWNEGRPVRVFGCFVFDLGCFVFEIWVLRASVLRFRVFFETTRLQLVCE